MLILKYILLALSAVAMVGFGVCGAWGVAADFGAWMNGCKGQYACLAWTFGLMGLGIAAVLAGLVWLLWRSIRKQKG